jgi:glycerol uptake facilitator protein
MNVFIAEFFGTMVLVLLGNGVVCNVLLPKTKGNGSGWIVIAAGWGTAVFAGACIANAASGAHLNPALTLAAYLIGKVSLSKAIWYMVSQMLGAMLGALLVYLFYKNHFDISKSSDDKLGCFCTSSAIADASRAFFCEAVGTFVLVFTILQFQSPTITLESSANAKEFGLGAVGLIPVALLVFGIGLSLGGTTGYAINPARDLGPRLIHHLLPIPGKRDSDWSYAWVPVFGPFVGALFAALLYRILVP